MPSSTTFGGTAVTFFKARKVCSLRSPVMRCPPNVHPQPALLHSDARGSRSAVRRACGAGGPVGGRRGPQGPWAPAGPGWRAERAARRPPAARPRCRDARGLRGELQGNFSQGKRPVVPTRSLPAFCLFSCRRLESGRVPSRSPCAARPAPLGGAPGRPSADPSARPSAGRPAPAPGPVRRPPSEKPRSPQARAPACARGAGKWGAD